MEDGEPVYEMAAIGDSRVLGELGEDALALCPKPSFVPKLPLKTRIQAIDRFT